MSAAALMGTLSTLDSNVFSNVPQRPPAQRPEFIKQIEPMWGDGAYAEERFIGEWMGSDEHLKDMTPSEFMEAGSAAGAVRGSHRFNAALRRIPHPLPRNGETCHGLLVDHLVWYPRIRHVALALDNAHRDNCLADLGL
jgi:hypothetical protein